MTHNRKAIDYSKKSYGRNQELAHICQLLNSGRSVSMPGPRRLGKSFILRQLARQGKKHQMKVVFPNEVGGVTSVSSFYESINKAIDEQRNAYQVSKSSVKAVAKNFFRQDKEQIKEGKLFGFLAHNPQNYFEDLLRAMNKDKTPWVILIDELPIFLSYLHRQGKIVEACALMNHLNSQRVAYPNVLWVITGSIGIAPLAKAGNYQGALVKYEHFQLHPLSKEQAIDYLMDPEKEIDYPNRNEFSRVEAECIIAQIGWLTVYYLEAVAKKMPIAMAMSKEEAQTAVDDAIKQLLDETDGQTFSVWEENLRKHYQGNEQTLAIKILQALSKSEEAISTDTLLASIGDVELSKETLIQTIKRLESEGYLSCQNWDAEMPAFAIRNALLKRWWKRYPLTITV